MAKPPDLEKERSERRLTPVEFVTLYNKDLPADFPRATLPVLEAFRAAHPSCFKSRATWSLGEHRKKLMDWMPQYAKETERVESSRRA